MTVVCQTMNTSMSGDVEEILNRLNGMDLTSDISRFLKVQNVRKYEGKRVAKGNRTLFCTGGKRVAEKKSFSFDSLKDAFTFSKAKRAQARNWDFSLVKEKACDLGRFALELKNKALDYVDSRIASFMGNEYIIYKNYFTSSLKKWDLKLYKAKLEYTKKFMEAKAKLASMINGEKVQKNKLALTFSCAALALTLGVTSILTLGASLSKVKASDLAGSADSDLSYIDNLLADSIKKSLAKSLDFGSKQELSVADKTLKEGTIETIEGVQIEEDTNVETQDGVEILDVQEETIDNVVASIDVSREVPVSSNTSQSGLQYFNYNDFYKCPDDVTTEELLAILGITPEQFYNKIYGITCAESVANLNGYVEVFVDFYTFLNRICDPSWRWSGGTNIYSQATYPSQYVVYEHNTYHTYLQYTDAQRAIALTAMRDAMYNFIVAPANRPHSWTSFRSYGTTSYSNILFTSRGNRFGVPMTNVVYPDFLQSEAAIALRNKALGISENATTLEDGSVYDYEDNSVILFDGTSVNEESDNNIISDESEMILVRTLD